MIPCSSRRLPTASAATAALAASDTVTRAPKRDFRSSLTNVKTRGNRLFCVQRLERVDHEHAHGRIVLVQRGEERLNRASITDLSECPRHDRLRLGIVQQRDEQLDSPSVLEIAEEMGGVIPRHHRP
jgi:hypothetical protein